MMMSGSKVQNSVRAYTIRCLTFGPAKHEGARLPVDVCSARTEAERRQ